MSTTSLEPARFAPGLCQWCGSPRPTKYVAFYRNVGMLLARRKYQIHGDLCKACIHRHYWKFTGKNLLLGPWGVVSLFVTPLYLIQNTGKYVSALYRLRDGARGTAVGAVPEWPRSGKTGRDPSVRSV
jgi:hypothetical protein